MSLQQYGSGVVISIDGGLLNNGCLEAIFRSCPSIQPLPLPPSDHTNQPTIVYVTSTSSSTVVGYLAPGRDSIVASLC